MENTGEDAESAHNEGETRLAGDDLLRDDARVDESDVREDVTSDHASGASHTSGADGERGERSTAALIADTSGDLLAAVAQIDRLSARQAAWKAEFIDQARRIALMTEEAVITVGKNLTPAQRQDLARRAFVAEVACELRIPERTAIGLIDESEALMHRLPLTLTALREGVITYRHAQTVIDQTATLDEDATAQLEEAALPFARNLTPARFRQKARTLRERMRPESASARREKRATDRKIEYLPAPDGMAWLNLYTTAPVAGALFTSIRTQSVSLQGPAESRTLGQLDADVCADALFAGLNGEAASTATTSPSDTAGRAFEDGADDGSDGGAGSSDPSDAVGPTGPDAPPRQSRSADGPGSAAGSTPARPQPGSRSGAQPGTQPGAQPGAAFCRIKPTVVVTVPVLSLLGRTDEPATLDGYGPIDIETARQLVGQATSFTRVLTDPETGAALSWGTKRYKPTKRMRQFLGYRDHRCRFPGCNRVAVFCDVDHTVDRQFGGPTELDNLAYLCPKHHRIKHDTTWKVEQIGGGSLRWTSPNGRLYVTHPENEVRPFGSAIGPRVGTDLTAGSAPPANPTVALPTGSKPRRTPAPQPATGSDPPPF